MSSRPSSAPAHLRQGQIYEQLGRPTEAGTHYLRFVELWEECDPELQPLVRDAQQRLLRLKEEPDVS